MKDEEHAELIQKYIDYKLENEEKWVRKSDKEIEYETEVPYNYYGDRGFIDLLWWKTVPESEHNWIYLYEMKTRFVDIGEAIRKVKHQKEYYPKAKSKELPSKQNRVISSILIVKDTKENRKTYEEHLNLFKNVNTHLFNIEKNTCFKFDNGEWITLRLSTESNILRYFMGKGLHLTPDSLKKIKNHPNFGEAYVDKVIGKAKTDDISIITPKWLKDSEVIGNDSP